MDTGNDCAEPQECRSNDRDILYVCIALNSMRLQQNRGNAAVHKSMQSASAELQERPGHGR